MQHQWFVKKEILPLFDEGKDLEVRFRSGSNWSNLDKVKVGHTLFINKTIQRGVVAIRWYDTAKELLEVEDFRRIAPGYTRRKIETFLWRLERGFEGRFVVFELERISQTKNGST